MAKQEGKKSTDKDFEEIPIAEEISEMNLNWATRKNAGDPTFGMRLQKNAPPWAKVLFFLIAAFIVFSLAVLLLGALLGVR